MRKVEMLIAAPFATVGMLTALVIAPFILLGMWLFPNIDKPCRGTGVFNQWG